MGTFWDYFNAWRNGIPLATPPQFTPPPQPDLSGLIGEPKRVETYAEEYRRTGTLHRQSIDALIGLHYGPADLVALGLPADFLHNELVQRAQGGVR